MRLILLNMTLLLLLVSCDTQQELTVGEVEGVPADAILEAYDDVPGLVRVTVMNGENIQMEGDLLNDLRHGSWIEFGNEGLISAVTTYDMGKKNGVCLKFEGSGYVTEKAIYRQGLLNGEMKVYSRRRVTEVKPYKNGKLEGVVRKYYSNGNVMEEVPYKDNKMDGLGIWYNEEGIVSFKYLYEKGELVDENP